ncbi:hypothetical protein EYF80_032986 [Liparis tanakae]|uniref:Uncharacterized protein n=1 Tax=Liparis tanakae TaxID=230148 RepID=A0A4Z2GT16_9TELE|nr:hypothetical protein EYF80_032986 [Liparis tanakae]
MAGRGVQANRKTGVAAVSCDSPLTSSSGSSSRPIVFFSMIRLFISSVTSETVCLCRGAIRESLSQLLCLPRPSSGVLAYLKPYPELMGCGMGNKDSVRRRGLAKAFPLDGKGMNHSRREQSMEGKMP